MHITAPLLGLLTLAIAFTVLSSPAQAQDDPLPPLQKRLDAFFAALTTTGVEPKAAFDDLLAGSPLEKSDDVKKLVDEVRKFDDKYGVFLEAEQISAKRVGKDLVLVKYLYKAQKFPVVWHFVFYRSPNKTPSSRAWAIISVRFDTRVELLGP